MILVIDNYDSFTWNLVDYLRDMNADVRVTRNDAMSLAEAMAPAHRAILISPGPGTAQDAGICMDVVDACASAGRPLLGICLGHQAIAAHFGSAVTQHGLMHGKTCPVAHDGTGLFSGLPSPMIVARYHSLCVEEIERPLAVNARTQDGLIMGLMHESLPIHGVQFHPESIGSSHGHMLLSRFLDIAGIDHDRDKASTRAALPR